MIDESKKTIRVRFAPSPTGHLHIGTARTALFNWLFARHYGGLFILRIEDTDRARSTAENELSIIEDMRWLGLNWDEGPDIGGDYGSYRQSERHDIYTDFSNRLLKQGSAYECFCTPEELEDERQAALAAGRMPMYGGRCRELSESEIEARRQNGEASVIRFNVATAGGGVIEFDDLIKGKISISSDVIGDFIILKADGGPTYNFAAFVDDSSMAITHVLRGEDHITNTARQIILFKVLEMKPPEFGHFSMILGSDRAKLSKRHGATAINDYLDQGYLPEAIVNYIALLSWSSESGEEIFNLGELVSDFTIERVSKSPAIFDQPKLDWLNGQWIRRLPAERLSELVSPLIKKSAESVGVGVSATDIIAIIDAIKTNLSVLNDVPKYAKIFLTEPVLSAGILEELSEDSTISVLNAVVTEIESVAIISIESAKEIIQVSAGRMKKEGIKGKAFYHPLRLALTGEASGPELFLVINGLGKDKTLERLRNALRVGRRE